MIPTIIKLVLPMIFGFIEKMEESATKEAITEVIKQKTAQYHEFEDDQEAELRELEKQFDAEDLAKIDTVTERTV